MKAFCAQTQGQQGKEVLGTEESNRSREEAAKEVTGRPPGGTAWVR